MDINTCQATTEGVRLLALYAHLIPASAILLLGAFVSWKASDRVKALVFASFCGSFALWLLSALIIWTFDDYNLVAAFWAPIDFIEIVFFLLMFYFVYIDLFKPTTTIYLQCLVISAAAPSFILTVLGRSVLGLDQSVCEMVSNDFVIHYKLYLEVILLGLIAMFGMIRILRSADGLHERVRVFLVTTSAVLFLGIFSSTEFIASYTGVYEINLYALFTLPLFILFLTISITSYGTFKLGDAAVKVLFYVFLVLAGTQFFFVGDTTEFLLALLSFVVVVTLGLLLFRSNEREIAVRHEVERLSEEKSEFMTFASHEIRNPITAMRGLASELADDTFGTLPKEAREAAEKILVAGNEVLALISEFLNKSKSELGQISYALTEFDAAKSISALIEGFKPNAEVKGLAISARLPERPVTVRADESKLKEVVGNLIDNAIKYTKTGSVTVSVEKKDKVVRIVVSDTGAGIPGETMSKLFQKFSRADAAKANLFGTGVGLYLAKTFIEGMGGKIWAESEGAGKGARFIIEFSG